MNKPCGLYIHIPFCRQKCAYCDFYSFPPRAGEINEYVSALIKFFRVYKAPLSDRVISSVYIGGGTPSLLGDGVIRLLFAARESFCIAPDAEITAEVNPESAAEFLPAAAAAGVNRISVGIQCSRDGALKALGRIHTADEAEKAVLAARSAGINNISGDLMIALPESDEKDLKRDIDFMLSLGLSHISAYILKAEPGTPLYGRGVSLPDDDTAADLYLYTCRRLEDAGFSHYEISNFAKPGFEGRHNLNYWRCGEYLGLGPAAHSYLDGKRFYYPPDIGGFMSGAAPVQDGLGGSLKERFMLGLRLSEGVKIAGYPALNTAAAKEKLARLEAAGYIEIKDGALSLTDKGFLISNAVITELS